MKRNVSGENTVLRNNGKPAPAPIRRTNLKNLILDRLREFVLIEGLVVDDRLPPERELAAQLEVSRPTLRSALKWLSARGALRRVQGGGTYLCRNFLSVLAQSHVNEDVNLAETIDARLHLEPLLARLAAQRVTTEEIARVRESVEESRHALYDPQAWCHHDLKFHLQLVRLSNNSVLSRAVEPLITRLSGFASESINQIDPARCLVEHEAILQALQSRDADAAFRRMTRHLETFVSVFGGGFSHSA